MKVYQMMTQNDLQTSSPLLSTLETFGNQTDAVKIVDQPDYHLSCQSTL